MLGYWVDEFARRAARLRMGRVRVSEPVVKINLGSGLHVADGWINVDGSVHSMFSRAPRAVLSLLYRSSNAVRAELSESEYIERLRNNRFAFAQLEGTLPFDDACADFIYSSHVLEHFFLEDARRLLREMLRVLKPGGVVRVCVPDLAHAMSLYQAGDARDALEFFFTESRTGYYRQHRYLYDFALLRDLLDEVGFKNIIRKEFQQGAVPDLDVLDNRPEETLYVEAQKLN